MINRRYFVKSIFNLTFLAVFDPLRFFETKKNYTTKEIFKIVSNRKKEDIWVDLILNEHAHPLGVYQELIKYDNDKFIFIWQHTNGKIEYFETNTNEIYALVVEISLATYKIEVARQISPGKWRYYKINTEKEYQKYFDEYAKQRQGYLTNIK